MRIIVIGAGDIGTPIIKYLSELGNILTVIDKDEKRCKEIANQADAAIFNGNATDMEIWKTIEAEKADSLLVLTNDDKSNIKACLIAKKQYGIPLVVARAREPENIEKLKEAGADTVICPSLATRSLFLNALKSQQSETIYEQDAENYKLVLVTIPPNGSVIGKTVNELDFSENIRVVTIFRNGGFHFPTESFMLKAEDRVLTLGESEEVNKATKKLMAIEAT